MVATLKAVKFLFTAPLILLMLFVINLMTSPGHWWVQWAALGLGIAWFCSLLKRDSRGHRGRWAGRSSAPTCTTDSAEAASSVAQPPGLRHGRAGQCPSSRQPCPRTSSARPRRRLLRRADARLRRGLKSRKQTSDWRWHRGCSLGGGVDHEPPPATPSAAYCRSRSCRSRVLPARNATTSVVSAGCRVAHEAAAQHGDQTARGTQHEAEQGRLAGSVDDLPPGVGLTYTVLARGR